MQKLFILFRNFFYLGTRHVAGGSYDAMPHHDDAKKLPGPAAVTDLDAKHQFRIERKLNLAIQEETLRGRVLDPAQIHGLVRGLRNTPPPCCPPWTPSNFFAAHVTRAAEIWNWRGHCLSTLNTITPRPSD